MSVRARKILKIKYTKEPSFNLSFDEKLVDFFDKEYGFFNSLIEGSGITELPTEALKAAVKKAKELELADWQIKKLKKEAKWGDKYNCGYVSYYCF